MRKYRFLLKFTGKDEEIDLLGDGTEKPEFGEWKWMSPEQVVDLVGAPCYLEYYARLMPLCSGNLFRSGGLVI